MKELPTVIHCCHFPTRLKLSVVRDRLIEELMVKIKKYWIVTMDSGVWRHQYRTQ